MKVSIIIVHYKVKTELFACLNSIKNSYPNISYEVIVVDNDEEKIIYKELRKNFPQVKYIPNDNKGFGQGNNIGAKYARGQYLFFLNPDTILQFGALNILVEFLEKNPKAGIVAPLLLDSQKNPYPLQGTGKLGIIEGVVAYSALNKFSKNPISRKFWLLDWDKKTYKGG